jgi:ABC-type polysaccharide/polyol phosphate transport system ATPase subunit
MSRVTLTGIGVDFVSFGASRDLKLSMLGGLTGGRILPERLSRKSVVIKALEDISLDLKSGDRVGLIGHNGAGKSTLLRVLGGIYTPSAGELRITGKLTPLLHQTPTLEMDDTGHDNIVTCGMLMGMRLAEIEAKVPEIAAFSDLGDYIHLPLRTYSSGMLARLMFSIVTSLEPGILLLDEDIGTVDAQFSEKASRRVKELIAKTDILVLASHADELINSMCNKAALLHHGRLLEFGPVAEVMKSYRRAVESTPTTQGTPS